MSQGKLFDDDAGESRKSEAEIDWKLRRLKQAWVDVSYEDPVKRERILQEIREVTRGLAKHPDWWIVPHCECEECREYDRSIEE